MKDLNDVYNKLKVTDYWEQPNSDTCRNIVIFLDNYIGKNPKDSRAYYLRSMAKFHLNYLVPPDYIMRRDSEYLKRKYNEDEAYQDYILALSLDSDIVEKNPDIRVIVASCNSCFKFYFRNPCPYKVYEYILSSQSGDANYLFSIIFFICVIALIILAIIFQNTSNLYYTFIWLIALFYCIYRSVKYFCLGYTLHKLCLKHCEKSETASWAEVK